MTNLILRFSWPKLLLFSLLVIACSAKQKEAIAVSNQEQSAITFIELGSVKCIPCKQMQPIMASIEKKYGSQINVLFYDVWEPDQKHFAAQYGVRLIPTQVFLDSQGLELMRHEGYFPEAEIDAFLSERGLLAQVMND
ncbi:MAG: thioredoxin family protein [Candidatus Marinimicrobia bacterium]|nr:thioredoxin family protein [Candidatus Neomarinimicrobiota bacterium]